MEKIILSILMTNFNYSRYLSHALDSILHQDYNKLEIIIVDDASTDNSVEIIKGYIVRGLNIKLFINSVNIGTCKSAQKALTMAQGEYILSLGSDDMIMPNVIRKSMRFIQKHSDVGIFTAIPGIFYGDMANKLFFKPMGTAEYRIFSNQEIIKTLLKTKYWFPGHSVIIKKKYVIKYGGYKETFQHFTDFILHMRIAINHGLAYMPIPLSCMRINSNSFSLKKRTLNEKFQLFQIIMDEVRLDKEFDNKVKKSAVLNHLRGEFLLFLIFRPKYWTYIYPIIFHRLLRFLDNKILSRILKNKKDQRPFVINNSKN